MGAERALERRLGAEARRRRLRRGDRRPARHLQAPPGARDRGRDHRHGPAYGPRARHAGRLFVRRERVQPRHAGVAAAGLGVQAVRLFRRARQRLHAVLRGHGRADRDPRRQRRVDAGELRRQVLRAGDAADRDREVAQRHDRPAGAGHGHAARRRIRQALRHLRQPRAVSANGASAPARPR